MSKAIRIHQNGGPEVLSLDDVDTGTPGPGQVLIRLGAIGLNFIDMHHRAGRYPLPELPVTLGMEGAGKVKAIGQDVRHIQVGDRVSYTVGGHGAAPCSYAEYVVMPADALIVLPEEISDVTAAAATLKGLTAQYLVRGAYPVKSGETILVHAAAGGVGLLLCQWASHLGARVIGTVGSEAKAELALAHGCDHIINYGHEDVAARVRSLTGGEGVPVAFDGVGKDTYESSLNSLKVRGTLVSYGTASGKIPPFDLFNLNIMGSLYVTSAGLAWYTRSRAELLQRSGELIDLLTRGIIKVPVLQQWDLADAARAHRAMEARETLGMSVLIP